LDINKLRQSYAVNAELVAICDELGTRTNNQRVTKLKPFLALLNRDRAEAIKQWKLIAAFRELEICGCGAYVEGRHGHPSRFVWDAEYGSLSICKAVFGEPLQPSSETTEENDESTELNTEDDANTDDESCLDHYFNLRADYQLEITLPVDLTVAEAERLAAFFKSLPLDDYQ
jgi:hypothetical protein